MDSETQLLRFIEIARALSSERDINRLFERILDEAQAITGAQGGTLYLYRIEQGRPGLEFVILRNTHLGLSLGGTSSNPVPFAPLPLFDPATRQPNHRNVATHAALTRQIVVIDDAYEVEGFDFEGAKAFDRETGYRSRSFLTVPLMNHAGDLIGVLQLLNAQDPESGEVVPFDGKMQPMIEALAGLISLVLANKILMLDQRDLLVGLSSEPTVAKLFERIVRDAQEITHADGGTLYLLNARDRLRPQLEFAIVRNNQLGLSLGGTSSRKPEFDPLPLYSQDGKPNHTNIATHCALVKKLVKTDDAYCTVAFDFSGTKIFDQKAGYRSQSFLTVPLLNHDADVMGVLQLVNAIDPYTNQTVPFSSSCEPVIEALASYAAIVLENQMLLEGHKDLLDAFVKSIAQAIDAKSVHTSGHCQRVPVLTEMLARAACEDRGLFRDFELNEDEWFELRTAAWMHDCGKLSTPDSVLDKSTKLHKMRDGIDLVEARFELLKRQRECEALRKRLSHDDQLEVDRELRPVFDTLTHRLNFLIRTNRGSEFLSSEDRQEILRLAGESWRDSEGRRHDLLTPDDVENLSVERGTLTSAEREIINRHIVVTLEMLESLPFPKNLQRVPEYAGGHHEKMDGTGFPRGLKGHQMSIPARMMAIADIFEALTAKDRPYKTPMKLSQALSVLRRMRDQQHIDGDLFRLFLEHRVWEQYARQYLNPEQIDITDPTPYL